MRQPLSGFSCWCHQPAGRAGDTGVTKGRFLGQRFPANAGREAGPHADRTSHNTNGRVRFRVSLAGTTVSGRMDLVATRDQELVIIDAKAAKPSEAHAVQVMLYMLFIQLQGARTQEMTVTGEVYYGEDQTVDIAALAAGEEFREMVEGLIGRLTAKTPPRKVPSSSECRFCAIPGEYCPERIDQ